MKKKIIIAILLFTTIIIHKIKTDNHNDGIICSYNTDIEEDFYNKGKLYSSNISIKGKIQNYKKGAISAKNNLKLNKLNVSVNKEKNENANAVIKRPDGFINIFLPVSDEVDPENLELIKADFEVKSTKPNHELVTIDDVVYVLKEYNTEPQQETIEENPEAPKPLFEKVKDGFLHFTKKMSGFLWLIEKEEFIQLEGKKYKVIKPDEIIIHGIAKDINLQNQGTISISGVKLEID